MGENGKVKISISHPLNTIPKMIYIEPGQARTFLDADWESIFEIVRPMIVLEMALLHAKVL